MKLAFVGMGSFLVYVSVKELLGGRFFCVRTLFLTGWWWLSKS